MQPSTASLVSANGGLPRRNSWRGAEALGLGLTQPWTITRTQDYMLTHIGKTELERSKDTPRAWIRT